MWSIRRVDVTGSTNADTAAAARSGTAEGLVVVADHQSSGRGRLDRTWHTPAGSALTASFLLRPADVPAPRWPWLPLLAGIAVVDAVGLVAPSVRAGLKWPNDVLVGGAKLAGILVERVESPTGPAAVVGIGLNVSQVLGEGLVEGAVSLRSAGASGVSRDEVLAAVGTALAARYGAWRAVGGDPSACGLADDYRARSVTLGRSVRAHLPGAAEAGAEVVGTAIDVDDTGRLVIDTMSGRRAVGAGDIVHLRPAN